MSGTKCPQCKFAGAKLHKIPEKVAKVVDRLQKSRAKLTLAQCDGHSWVYLGVKRMLTVAISELKLKTNFYSLVPWLFSNATKPEVARECLRQIESVYVNSMTSFAHALCRCSFYVELSIVYGCLPFLSLATACKAIHASHIFVIGDLPSFIFRVTQ